MTRSVSLHSDGELLPREEGEFSFIEKIHKILSPAPSGAHHTRNLGYNDDGAIIPRKIVGENIIISVDAFVSNQHFRKEFSEPEEIGFKAISSATSDLAAMGAKALFTVINLQIGPNEGQEELLRAYKGIKQFCDNFGMSVIGGNVSSASELSFGVTVIGTTEKKPLMRSGAKPEEDLWLSGAIGLSSLGLKELEGSLKDKISEELLQKARKRYCLPEPRLALGEQLSRLGASSCIDISDGLFQDAGHIASQSEVQLVFELQKILISEMPLALNLLCLTGGADYELLFSSSRELRPQIQILDGVVRCGFVREVPRAEQAGVFLRDLSGLEHQASDFLRKNGLSSMGVDHLAAIGTSSSK